MRLGLLAFFVTCILQAQEPAKTAPRQLQLRGDRFHGMTYDEMTPEQKTLTDRALAGRGTIGTFNILLRSPGLSEAVRGTAGGRAGSPLTQKQSELAIIINARYWTTQFEWLVHHRAAVQAGVSEATVAAIAEGRRPTSMPRDEEVVYNFVRELLKTKQVSDPTFAAAKSLLGERGIVDLIGLVGFYQSTSLMMNVDRYPMQGDQKPELKKLENPLPTGARLEQAPTTRGRRFPPLSTNQITPEQRHMADLVTSGKIQDGTGGSFNVLLRSPALGEAVVRYGEYVRFRSPLPAQLNQLAALITARYWTAQFPWYAHHRAAVQAGLSETAISAIAGGRRPTSLQPDEEAVYNFCTELLKTSEVSDATYRAVKDQLGEAGVVELLGIVGYYGTVSMLVNTDRYPLPDGATPELRPLPESR